MLLNTYLPMTRHFQKPTFHKIPMLQGYSFLTKAIICILCLISITDVNLLAQTVNILKTFDKEETLDFVKVTDQGFVVSETVNGEKYYNILSPSGVSTKYELQPGDVTPPKSYVFDLLDRTLIISSLLNKGIITFNYTNLNSETGDTISRTTNFLEVSSKDQPYIFCQISPDNKNIALVVVPVKEIDSDVKGVPYTKKITNHAELYLFTTDLQPIWNRIIDYTSESKSYVNKVACDNLQNIYVLNAINPKSYSYRTLYNELQCYGANTLITDTLDEPNIGYVNLLSKNDGILLTGLKRKENEINSFFDGTYLLELEPGTLKVKQRKVNNFSLETMNKFVLNSTHAKTLKKNGGIMQMAGSNSILTFSDGTIASFYRQWGNPYGDPSLEPQGSILIYMYTPDGGYHENVIWLSQSTMSRSLLNYNVALFQDKLYIIFNDASSNHLNKGDKKPNDFFASKSGVLPSEGATYAVIIDSGGNLERITLFNYESEKFLFTNAYTMDGKHWLIYGTQSLSKGPQSNNLISMLLTIE